MTMLSKRFTLLVLVFAVAGLSQTERAPIVIGETTLHVGMPKQEAINKLTACCRTTMLGALPSLGDSSAMVTSKTDVNDIFGFVYFRDGKITGVLASRDWSQEPDSYKSALSLYRLVDKNTGGRVMRATVAASTREATNASTKTITISFDNGRSIIIEAMNPDPGQKFTQQVTLSECIGVC